MIQVEYRGDGNAAILKQIDAYKTMMQADIDAQLASWAAEDGPYIQPKPEVLRRRQELLMAVRTPYVESITRLHRLLLPTYIIWKTWGCD